VTPAVLDRPGSVTERPVLGGGGTLEELLSATLRSAQANGSTECPVCRARMTSTRAGAECGGCGSRLR
jgi:tRNA(Ile2) C34 agmatinyltransferase TiaS